MADFGAPVAQNVQGPDAGLQTLSHLFNLKQQQLGIARQQIGLQQAQQELSQQTSQATIAGINASQRQSLAGENWNQPQYKNPDGTPNIQAVQSRALQLAPGPIGEEFATNYAQMATTGAAMKQSFLNLTNKEQEGIRALAGEFGGDPKARYSDFQKQMELYRDNAPSAVQPAIQKFMDHLNQLATSPDPGTGQLPTTQEIHNFALAFSRGGLSVPEVSGSQGVATPQAGTVDTGTQVVATTRTPATGNVITPAGTIAEEHQPITLPNSQVAIWNKATNQYEIAGGGGAKTPSQPPSGGPAMTAFNDPARPGPNAPVQAQQQWTQALQNTQKEVDSTRTADANYPNQMAIAQDVRELSKASNTGPGTPELTRVIGAITSRFGGSQGVTDVQTLESFLDRQAAGMRSAMGLPATNAGAEQSQIIGGNIGMQGGALRAKNDYNEALAQGLHDYRLGLDKVAGYGGNYSPTAVNRFRSQWAQYFNPTAYEYELAKKRGDRQLQDAIVKNLSPAQAKRMVADIEITARLAKGLPP